MLQRLEPYCKIPLCVIVNGLFVFSRITSCMDTQAPEDDALPRFFLTCHTNAQI